MSEIHSPEVGGPCLRKAKRASLQRTVTDQAELITELRLKERQARDRLADRKASDGADR